MSKVLIVLSAADKWTRADGSKYPTGYWAEEFVVIHEKLVGAGCAVDIATPEGQKPTADHRSLDPNVAGPAATRCAEYLASISDSLASPLKLSDVDMEKYDAVVIPGGHGPVEDLYKDPAMGRLLFAADDADKIIASVCHGPAALISATDSNGKWLFEGRRMTAFSDEEEIEFGTADNAPWLLAKRLKELGATYEHGPNWGSFVVRDGRLISGQNPASSAAVADAVIAALNETNPASLRARDARTMSRPSSTH
jgi:putative intracellular protease/amidase